MKEQETRFCPYEDRCGGCPLAKLPYEAQLAQKTRRVQTLLKPFGGKLLPCVGGPGEGCRNKVHLVFGREGGRPAVGFFSAETHRMVRVERCRMHGDWFPALAQTLEEWAGRFSIPVYEPRTGRGLLRFAVGRYLDGKLMLTVVSRSGKVPGLPALHRLLEQRIGPTALWLNLNDRRDSAVFSPEFHHIAGPRQLTGTLLGVEFRLSPDAFFQVNQEMAARLYTQITRLARESGAETVVDAYSGIGITSLLFAGAGMRVVSVEQVPSAVSDARVMARQNGLSQQIRALCGDCAKVLPRLEVPEETLFFVDPPRRGLGERVCATILDFAPRHMIYLSCGPESLAEDLRRLTAGGYRLISAQPYDMFPNTEHVECCVLLCREDRK